MLRLMLNTAFTVLAKEGKENVTVTLESMTRCLQKKGVIILNSRSGSVYMRYNPGEHNLTKVDDLICNLYISAPSDMHINIEILAKRTDCTFVVKATDTTNNAWVTYCQQTAREDMHTSKRWVMSSDLVELYVAIYRLTTPFVFHLRFKTVQASQELQVYYDSPKQGK